MPGDPKLLRLQQKIRKQKEKQKAEMIRGHRRKEKIQQLQALLRNNSKLNHSDTNPELLRGEGLTLRMITINMTLYSFLFFVFYVF